jgi:hypothetical protein
MTVDTRGLAWLLSYQCGVLSRQQASRLGMTDGSVRHRIRPGGPWQRLLPGVYLTATGQPSWEQLQVSALLFAGADSLITGPAALLNYKILRAVPRLIDVLVPLHRERTSPGFLAVHRTRRMPRETICDGPVRYAPPARAVADTVRAMTGTGTARAGTARAGTAAAGTAWAGTAWAGTAAAGTAWAGMARAGTAWAGTARGDLAGVRAVVAGAVQQGRCTIAELAAELQAGPVRGSATLRSVLAEVLDGVRSPAEADLRALIRASDLPEPLYNPKLYLPGGIFLAEPDAWWPHHGVAAEVDSREWHLSPADWEATMARHARMSAAGIIALHFSPRQQRERPAEVIGTIAGALRTGRPLPAVITRAAAA